MFRCVKGDVRATRIELVVQQGRYIAGARTPVVPRVGLGSVVRHSASAYRFSDWVSGASEMRGVLAVSTSR